MLDPWPDNLPNMPTIGTIVVGGDFMAVYDTSERQLKKATVSSVLTSSTLVILADGTVPLTADWDAGAFEIRAQTFESDVTTGTAPLVIASTTLVSNLNADLLDSQEGAYYLDSANFTGTNWTDLTDSGDTTLHGHDHDGLTNFVANEHTDHTSVTLTAGSGLSGGGDISTNRTFDLGTLTGNWDAGAYEIRALKFQSDQTTGTAPMIVASTTKVANFNADLLDGQEGTYYLDSANFSGTTWTDLTDSGVTILHTHTLGSLSNVTIGAVATGNTLYYNGTAWVNTALISVAAARVTISTADVAITGIPSGAGAADLRIAADGDIMYQVSSERFKTDIESWSVADNDIFGVTPVSFRYKDEVEDKVVGQDESGDDVIRYGDLDCRKSIGWTAEDMFAHAPDAVILDAEGKPYNIDWHAVTLMLWEELKILRAEVETLKRRHQ